MDKIKEILDYWFGQTTDDTLIDQKQMPFKKWFSGDALIDEEICQRFEGDLMKGKEGVYRDWEKSVRGTLALVILFDQFSRNMYRGTPLMFSTDWLALDLTRRAIKDQKDKELLLIERSFLYMPLMHSEDPEMQKLSLKFFADLITESKKKNPHNTSYYENSFKYVKNHFATIEQFGRFPHRDKILKRVPYLKEERAS